MKVITLKCFRKAVYMCTYATLLRESPSYVFSGGKGEKYFLFSKTLLEHQGFLTVGVELQTFPAEPSTATVPLLKKTFHQWKNMGLKACYPDNFVP